MIHSKTLLVTITLIAVISCNRPQNKRLNNMPANRDTLLVLNNDSITLAVSQFGGAIVKFAFNDQKLNPLDWKIPKLEMPENNRRGAPFQGHFLCIGRWGSPTKGEKDAGIPHNGEPSNCWWKDTLLLPQSVEMKTITPLEQWQVNRKIKLSPNQAFFEVEETLTNLQNCGRFTTIVQHATLGGDFLNEGTIINCNASDGFNQSLTTRSITEFEYKWPLGFIDSMKTSINLTLSGSKSGFVTTHIIDGQLGWATAATPSKGLLIGYVWKSSEYPWMHIWHGMKNGKLWAKGIEFGTTGLGDTYSPEKRAITTFHGRTNNLFIDAHATLTKRYACFLIRIPNTFVRIVSIETEENKLVVTYLTGDKTNRIVFNSKII